MALKVGFFSDVSAWGVSEWIHFPSPHGLPFVKWRVSPALRSHRAWLAGLPVCWQLRAQPPAPLHFGGRGPRPACLPALNSAASRQDRGSPLGPSRPPGCQKAQGLSWGWWEGRGVEGSLPWASISFSRGSPPPRDRTWVSSSAWTCPGGQPNPAGDRTSCPVPAGLSDPEWWCPDVRMSRRVYCYEHCRTDRYFFLMKKTFPTQGLCFTIINKSCESRECLDAANVPRRGRLWVGIMRGCSNQMYSLVLASPSFASGLGASSSPVLDVSLSLISFSYAEPGLHPASGTGRRVRDNI